nr:leukocyte antigen CD37 [Misgurnus anguillicaudatus]XP_055031403.1 leukocyte antigen CD37 [Misgurnus anguillicaudatus]XP_055031404.1 leukocyte antigen CD37 [Misgurnus anguillicaudatus]XP_055031405.1 leukocyte antigen CD37 [Misgurnus anguillicaudatus]
MASEFCLSFTKYFLFLFNLMFFILGSLVLALGLWVQFSDESIFMSIISYLSISLFSNLLIICGSVTLSLGFLGCLGSLRTVKCLLATYFILLTVLFAAQLVGGVLLYTQEPELENKLKEQSFSLIKSFGKNSSLQNFERTFEYIQQKGKCCGWENKADWLSVPCSCYYTNYTVYAKNSTIQDLCPQCSSNVSISNENCKIYDQGCGKRIQKWLEENHLFMMVVIIAIAAVEICGMILSMYLYKENSVDYSTFPY